MASVAELDVLIKAQATGTSNLKALNNELVTAEQYTTTYGAALSKQEAAYARSQLGALEAQKATSSLSKEFNNAAGSLLGFNGGLIGAAISLGTIYELGKSALQNSESQDAAARDLAQAFATQGKAVPTAQVQQFLETNKRLIDNQYDAEAALAKVTRAGFAEGDAWHMETEAMQLAIINHESMSDAMDTLIKASQGSGKALLDLGIKESTIADPTKALATAQRDVAKADDEKAKADRALQEELDRLHGKHTITQADLDKLADLKAKDLAATQNDTQAHKDLSDAQIALAASGGKWAEVQRLIDQRLQGAQGEVTDLHGDQSALNKDWQDFSARIGPLVTGALDDIVKAADTGTQILTELFTIVSAIINSPGKFATAVNTLQDDFGSLISGSQRARVRVAPQHQQFGGQVYGGQSYIVGEAGPELLTLGAGMSGNITPNDRLGGMTDMTESNMYLAQLVDLMAALVNNPGGGLGYSTLAAVEYSRSRGFG